MSSYTWCINKILHFTWCIHAWERPCSMSSLPCRSGGTAGSGWGSSDLKGLWTVGEVRFQLGVAKIQQSFPSLQEQFLKWPQDGNSTLRTSLETPLFFWVGLCVCHRGIVGVISWVCVSTCLYVVCYFSSLSFSLVLFRSFPSTLSLTYSIISPRFSKMNITWHRSSHFYDLYSLTRTFCSLLKRRQHNRNKNSSVIFWSLVALGGSSPSIHILSCWQQVFWRRLETTAGPNRVEMCLYPW